MTIVVIFITVLQLNFILYAILNTSYLVPTAHCTDAKMYVKVLSRVLGNGKA